MKNFADSVVNFLKEEDGPTAVEYAVMLAMIVIAAMVSIQLLGSNLNGSFEHSRSEIQSAVGS